MIVEGYRFGKIVIDGQEYNRDLLILSEGVKDGWWRAEGHSLSMADLEEVLADAPRILIVGTGFFGLIQVSTNVREALAAHGIETHILPTRHAWSLYNRLAASERQVAAAFHLAC
jgi:hypothetical protein